MVILFMEGGIVLNKSIGTKIEEMLRIRDMKPVDLAKLSGISPAIISRIISEKRDSITTDTLKKIAKALSIHPAYFLEDDVIGPEELLKHITNPKDREFILSQEGAMWVKLTREAAESGLSPDKIRKLIEILKDRD